jgi:acylphosphatase
MLKTITVLIQGKVQGVFYRQSAKDKAKEIGITGFVKNQPDGSVYAIATGTEEQLSLFIDWCQQGPPKAIVTNIEIQPNALLIFETFRIDR